MPPSSIRVRIAETWTSGVTGQGEGWREGVKWTQSPLTAEAAYAEDCLTANAVVRIKDHDPIILLRSIATATKCLLIIINA